MKKNIQKNFYIGIDISNKFINYAKNKHSKSNRTFIAGDIGSIKSLPQVDICVISGLFNFRIENNIEYTKSIMEKLFKISSEMLIGKLFVIIC